MMLRDAPEQSPGPESDRALSLTEAVLDTARSAGAHVIESTATAGHPVARLAELMALTDFASTYLALGFGVDPAVSPHVADLRDRTSDH